MSEQPKKQEVSIDIDKFINNVEETLAKGRVKRYLAIVTKYQSVKVFFYTYSSVTILNWIHNPTFWSVVDWSYKGIKYWLLGS